MSSDDPPQAVSNNDISNVLTACERMNPLPLFILFFRCVGAGPKKRAGGRRHACQPRAKDPFQTVARRQCFVGIQ